MNNVDCHDITTQEQLRNKQSGTTHKKEIHCRKAQARIKHKKYKRQSRTHRKVGVPRLSLVAVSGHSSSLPLYQFLRRKNPSTATVIVAVTCVGKKEGLEWI
jgi:hypothetical protein